MAFEIRNKFGTDYVYFRAGLRNRYYLGRSGKENPKNILKSLEYVREKIQHYSEIEQKLILMLEKTEWKR